MPKTLVCIRHGTALHNAYLQTLKQEKGDEEGPISWDRWLMTEDPIAEGWAFPSGDTPLTETGMAEGQALGQRLLGGEELTDGETQFTVWDLDLIIVSPLRRALQTCNAIFGTEPLINRRTGERIPIVARALTTESPQGSHLCNKRGTSRSEAAAAYPHIDFTELAEEDVVWQEAFRATEGKGENSEMIQARADEFVATLRSAPEEKVAIVSHSGLLTAILYGAGNDGVGGSLKHCDPYVIQR